jgi:hypothetical protein
MIFDEHQLLTEFLQSFLSIDVLKDIEPTDIEDVTERFLSLIAEQKDGDTVKRINLKGGDDKPLFVITIIEHESSVNFRAPFKMLLYIAMVLDNYEKEANSKESGISRTKGFKYPPILPIIFYDGNGNWTAEKNFLNRTEMSDVFEKYIPKFEYELVNLSQYSASNLSGFGNWLSLFMIACKIKTADDFAIFKELPKEYFQKLDKMNIPPHLKELLTKVITVLLTKADIPMEEIDTITRNIDERGISEMIALENYSVRETRREARAEGRAEGEAEGRAALTKPLQAIVKILLDDGYTLADIAAKTNLSERDIEELFPEFSSA